jgi:spore maturation protein SpmA
MVISVKQRTARMSPTLIVIIVIVYVEVEIRLILTGILIVALEYRKKFKKLIQ